MFSIIKGNNPQNIVEKDCVQFLSLWKKEEKNPFLFYLLYQRDEQIVGYLIYSKMYERMEIEQFKVLETEQNKGIGTTLLQELIKIAEREKIENITLEVKENNKKAIYLYKKFNFQEVAKRKNYYQDCHGILMIKEISS